MVTSFAELRGSRFGLVPPCRYRFDRRSVSPVHATPGAAPKPATAATRAYLAELSASLPFADRDDFGLATRGFVAPIPGNRIVDAEGDVLRDLNVDSFFRNPHRPRSIRVYGEMPGWCRSRGSSRFRTGFTRSEALMLQT